MGFFKRKTRPEKACWVQFAGGKAIVLGKTARELRALRSGWHGPWTIVTLRGTSNDLVLKTKEEYVNLDVATQLFDMTVLVEAGPPPLPVSPAGTPPPGMGQRIG